MAYSIELSEHFKIRSCFKFSKEIEGLRLPILFEDISK